jgi:hypothetical protein
MLAPISGRLMHRGYNRTVNDRPCTTCSARDRVTYVRDNFITSVDTTLGLTHVSDEIRECPTCGLRYQLKFEPSTRFHDYDEYFFTKLEGPVEKKPEVVATKPEEPAGPRRVVVCRCPKCGSTNAEPDESRSAYEFTYMKCHACGHGGLVDSWERDFDWFLQIELPAGTKEVPSHVAPLAPGEGLYDHAPAEPSGAQPESPARTATPAFGCMRCFGDDAATAWQATQGRRRRSLVEEPHFGVHISECDCGQAFAVVFTERIDFRDGDDEQDWLVVPLTPDDRSQLSAARGSRISQLITEFGRERRFLVRNHAPGAPVSAWWRDGGLAIGRHD